MRPNRAHILRCQSADTTVHLRGDALQSVEAADISCEGSNASACGRDVALSLHQIIACRIDDNVRTFCRQLLADRAAPTRRAAHDDMRLPG
jgi:hypothetical protein